MIKESVLPSVTAWPIFHLQFWAEFCHSQLFLPILLFTVTKPSIHYYTSILETLRRDDVTLIFAFRMAPIGEHGGFSTLGYLLWTIFFFRENYKWASASCWGCKWSTFFKVFSILKSVNLFWKDDIFLALTLGFLFGF